MTRKNIATLFAVLAASVYAINIPLSKILLRHISATTMAGLLYFGAGIGMLIYHQFSKRFGKYDQEPLTKKELPYTLAMILLDIIAPILLMLGIMRTNSSNASLLNNFEIVATSIIALLVFKEIISKQLRIAIGLVTIAGIILTFDGNGAWVLNEGSLLVLGASICWGFENNCTRMLSNKSSEEIVIIKGIFSGLGSLMIAFFLREPFPAPHWIVPTMLLGFFAYGMSINLYILAQKELGAAKTSAYYSIAPFLGVTFGILLLGERPDIAFFVALTIMIVATWLMVRDSIELQHTHEHEHTHSHVHSHGDRMHTHDHTHRHEHIHLHDADTENHSHEHDDLHEHIHAH